MKKILDVCCWGRTFRWDKNNPLAEYMDIRREEPWGPFPMPDPNRSRFFTLKAAEAFIKMFSEKPKIVKEFEI